MTRWLTIALLGLVLGTNAATAADTTYELEILDFYVYPTDDDELKNLNKLGGYTWPEVTQLNALIKVRVGGFAGEEKVDLYMVVLDEDEEVVSKHKGKHYLPPGEHSLVFPHFISTTDVFNRRDFELEVEADMKGVKPVYDDLNITLEGPEAPEVDILELDIYDTEDDFGQTYFQPGDQFVFEALFEVEDNDSDVAPEVIIFAMVDEDAFLIDPEMNYQPFDAHWDSRRMDSTEGLFRVRAEGILPLYFSDYHDLTHDWRVYLIVDFGEGATEMDYEASTIFDHDSGEDRYSEELADRLIEIDRGYLWEVKRLRGDRPDTDRFWENERR